MTDSLDDLNIVSIAPAQSLPKIAVKKKKMNKYERRRQRAKKAREGKRSDSSAKTKSENGASDAPMNPEIVSGPINQTSDKQNNDPAGKKYVKEGTNSLIATDSKISSKNERQPKKGKNYDSVPQKYLPKGIVRKDIDSVTIGSEVDNVNEEFIIGASRTSDFGRSELHNEEERAKYMAEFHARPMELDRRSGARSTTIVSTESTHLFTSDVQSNGWESLNIYPRLIKTLRSPAFGSLQKPTTIQSNAIRAFHESTHAMLRDDAETKNSSNKNKKKNVLIHSETGSGKTLAYILPILQSLSFGNKVNINYSTEQPTKRTRSEMGCRCIILCPTRELASQTLQVLEPLCQANFPGRIVPGCLLGGDSRKSEKASLRKGLAIIVATPGRLLDHLHKTQSLALSLKGKLKWIVLDEADRLLDMGLGDQVRQIVQWIWANEACSSHEQPWWRSVLISATITPSVQSLAKERILCGDQEWIWVKGESKYDKKKRLAQEGKIRRDATDASGKSSDNVDDFAHSTPRQLAQFHVTVTAKLRLSTLVAFLVQRVSKGERTVVFMGTCASVDFHHQLFNALEESLWDDDNTEKYENGTSTAVGLFGKKARVFKLHGSVSHLKRCQTMKELNANTSTDARKLKAQADILLTTDVSARGLNLKDFDWTVQYDPPCEISDYVHRVGRVARAGRAGHSLLFLLPSERKYIEVLQTKGINSLTPLSLSSILNQAASTCKELTKEGSRQQGEGAFGSTKNNKHSGQSRSSRLGEYFTAEIQRRMENHVVLDDAETRKAFKESTSKRKQKERKRKLVKSTKDGRKEGLLLEMAREAFLSFLRAYSTKKEPVVRSIFSSRALHFGHIAKSFALKEPPKSLVSKHKSKREQQEGESKDVQANLPRSLEFAKPSLDLMNFSGRDNSDDEDIEYQSIKRKKTKHNEKLISAKSLLLENAAKMQRNLMDAM